jgi:MazG family protein
MEAMQDETTLEDTLELMRDLRRRCEWDRAQTHDSLRPYLIEEAHEVDDAIRSGDDVALREELGDLLLQVLFHSVVAEERGAFSLHDVARGLIAKMRDRHPHLYPPEGSEPGERPSWEGMKAKARKRTSLEEGLPSGLPSLHRAHRLQDRAAGIGFDWPDVEGPLGKVAEELAEVRHELATGADPSRVESEIGDLLFSVVNVARKAHVHAALALDKTNAKFTARFSAVERLAAARGIDVTTAGLTVLDELWDEVKAGGA